MKQLLKFSIVLMVMFGCHRDKVEFTGPAYISAPAGFSVSNFTGTPSPIDFTSTYVTFNATFTSSVSWILTIKGQQSGAVRKITGINNSLNNTIWTGTHDGLEFFRRGEVATATLSFFGTEATYSVNVTIAVPPDFTTCGQFPKDGDYEIPANTVFPNWARFNTAGASQGVDSMAIDYNGNLVPSVQGKNYYFIKGLGSQAVFVDGIQYIGPLNPVLPATPDNVWVNMFIYGTGDANTAVEIEYQEADADGIWPGYQGYDDDAFIVHLNLTHKGWKLFSFPYSKLTPSLNADFGGSGNKIHEPQKLQSFDLVLLKQSNPNSAVEVYFDYPIITIGGPFKPCK